jgi:adenylate cyclase
MFHGVKACKSKTHSKASFRMKFILLQRPNKKVILHTSARYMERDIAILMADLTGYTAMTDVHGGASAYKVVKRYMEIVDKALYGEARVIQRVGDQVVIISDQALDIAITAQRLNAISHEEHHFLSIHAGIHAGLIFEENGNLFGSTINIASRIMNLANRGQVLCSSAFADNLQGHPEISFKPVGKHKLKNVMSEIDIVELCVTSTAPALYIDPVCHMLVDPDKGNHVLQFQDKTFHFCGQHCMDLFKASPLSYAAGD